MNKIAFATEVTYPNYCHRIKESILKNYIESKLYESGYEYHISTNMPDMFNDYKDKYNIFIYNVDDLRNDCPASYKFELLPDDPVGLYPGRYPWNLRRYIIRQAAYAGSNYVIYLDADCVFTVSDATKITKELNNNYEPNIVATNQAIFRYENRSPADVFQYHDQYINHFKTNFSTEQHDTIDGPVQIFMGQNNNDIINLINKWTELTIFGYQKPIGVGYENNKHGNLSFVIPMSNFTLRWKSFPFTPHHVFSDRY